jgi:hypothetical protein
MPTVHKRDNLSDEARIAKRLRPSNDQQTADTFVTTPDGTHHSVHKSGQNLQHDNPKSRSLVDTDFGNARIPVAGPPNFGKGRS